MIETNWSPEFQHLILAAALRGDLLRQIPLDPELFRPRDKGPKPPEQRVAELAVKFYEKYKTKPTLAEFDQLLAEARFGPERVPEIADVMAAVRAAPVPEDLTSILDTVRDQIEKRRIEKALFESAPELDKPDGAERAREILAKAIAPGGNGSSAGSRTWRSGCSAPSITSRSASWWSSPRSWGARLPFGRSGKTTGRWCRTCGAR